MKIICREAENTVTWTTAAAVAGFFDRADMAAAAAVAVKLGSIFWLLYEAILKENASNEKTNGE